jgi:hypothetical protein
MGLIVKSEKCFEDDNFSKVILIYETLKIGEKPT